MYIVECSNSSLKTNSSFKIYFRKAWQTAKQKAHSNLIKISKNNLKAIYGLLQTVNADRLQQDTSNTNLKADNFNNLFCIIFELVGEITVSKLWSYILNVCKFKINKPQKLLF